MPLDRDAFDRVVVTASGDAALEMSPFSMGAASGGVLGISDHLLAMANRVVSAAAREDHAIADTCRSPATVLVLHNGVIHSDFTLIFILLLI